MTRRGLLCLLLPLPPPALLMRLLKNVLPLVLLLP
jgi:hypothetical protein